MSGTHRGYILEFPLIRIDCFSQLNPPLPPSLLPAPNALLYLLTHVHTDHLQGLSRSSFNGKIICSRETKEMLIRLETAAGRRLKAAGRVERNLKIYGNLKDSRIERTIDLKRARGLNGPTNVMVDRFTVIPYNEPQPFNLGEETVQITMIPANHCPGSSMFLITSPTKAILHTGDIRADLPYLSRLRLHPMLQEFVWDDGGFFDVDARVDGVNVGGKRRLDRIYLDTGMLIGTGDMPSRDEAVESLISTMKIYPANTRFYISFWTWGYEEVLKAIFAEFGEKIYVDEYKGQIYYAIGAADPHLKSIITNNPESRFHACDHAIRCQACRKGKGDIVEIHWAEVMVAAFPIKHQRVVEACLKAKEGEGEWPRYLLSPVARHSPLPELRALVRLFRPMTISPNTLLEQTYGTDYYVMIGMFRDLLGPGGAEIMEREATTFAQEKLAKSKLTGGVVPAKWEVEEWTRRLFGLREGEELTREALGRLFGPEMEQEFYGEECAAGRPISNDSAIDLAASVHSNPTRHLREEYIDPEKRQAALEVIAAEWEEYVETTGNYIEFEGFCRLSDVKLLGGTAMEVGSGKKENKKIQVGAFLEALVAPSGEGGKKQGKEAIDVGSQGDVKAKVEHPSAVIDRKATGRGTAKPAATQGTPQDVKIIDLMSQDESVKPESRGLQVNTLKVETDDPATISTRKTMEASGDKRTATGDKMATGNLVKVEEVSSEVITFKEDRGEGADATRKRIKIAHTGTGVVGGPTGNATEVKKVDVATDAETRTSDNVAVLTVHTGLAAPNSTPHEHPSAATTPSTPSNDRPRQRTSTSSSSKQSSNGHTTPGKLALTAGTKELIAKMKQMRKEREG